MNSPTEASVGYGAGAVCCGWRGDPSRRRSPRACRCLAWGCCWRCVVVAMAGSQVYPGRVRAEFVGEKSPSSG
jgi:hypothetical protein